MGGLMYKNWQEDTGLLLQGIECSQLVQGRTTGDGRLAFFATVLEEYFEFPKWGGQL